jgi:DNA-binding response OmpR family regulator
MAKILIVDDHPHILRLLQRELATEQHAVATAATGEEALHKARSEAPDVMVLDVMMPGMSGLEVLRALKSDPATRAIVVILLSALNEPGEMTYGLQLGADWFLNKPFAPGDISTLVRRFLDQPHWSRPAPRNDMAPMAVEQGEWRLSTAA